MSPSTSDYGTQLFKAEQRGVPKFNPVLGRQSDAEEGIENSVKASLLYTAPEILRTGVSHPDHVGAGTLQGDMYSMAMIMVEIQTHEASYNEFLDYVDIDDLLQAIAGQKSIKSQLPPVRKHTCFPFLHSKEGMEMHLQNHYSFKNPHLIFIEFHTFSRFPHNFHVIVTCSPAGVGEERIE